MKNYADLGGCYPPQPSASADNTLLDLHNSSYHTQPHPIIANYFARRREASNCIILTVSPSIYAIGEKKPDFFFRLLFPNCINSWAHGEDRAIASKHR